MTSADVESVFGVGVWDEGMDARSEVAPGMPTFFGVDVSHNRTMGYISAAGLRADGSPHVEVIEMRSGPEWIVPFLAENFPKSGASAAVIQGRGAPASSLIEHLEAAGVPVIRCEGTALGASHGRFFDAVRARRVKHVPQPVLDMAALDGVMRPLGDVSIWDRKNSPVDVSPLIPTCQG